VATSLYVLGRGLVDPATPVIAADDAGVQRGDGLFETVRVCGGRPVLLDAHLERMARGAERVGIVVPAADEWREAATAAVEAAGAGDALLKLLCTRGPEGGQPLAFAMVAPVPEATVRGREHGVHAVVLGLGSSAGVRVAAPWLLAGVKTTSYAVNMAALREAQARGFDDAVWVDVDGVVLEAPTANVAWVRDGVVVTPPAEEVGVLRGTTIDALVARAGLDGLDGVKVQVRSGHVGELRAADEVLLTSSVRGVAPVLSLDRVAVGSGTVGPVTAALRAAYEEICASD
jgi:4-amino-4-deoxychorismate lyase